MSKGISLDQFISEICHYYTLLQSYIPKEKLVIPAVSTTAGIFFTWLITKNYYQKSKNDIEKCSLGQDAHIPYIQEILKSFEEELSEDNVKLLITEAYKNSDPELLNKSKVLGSLVKFDNGDSLVAYKEIYSYDSDIVAEYFEYFLCQLTRINDPVGMALILSLLITKLGKSPKIKNIQLPLFRA